MIKNSSNSIKLFLVFFVPLLLFFLGITIIFLVQESKTNKKVLMVNELQTIEKMRRIANDNIMSVVTDLFFLSVHPNLRQVIENDNPTLRQRVAEDFKKFCIHSKRYDQIRFLDKTGMEQIRINFNQNRPGIVSKDKLQNKSKRYYFTDTIALESGRIFVSPFDLNIENGQIQHPLKPMIRFGTPVLDLSGQKKGIVLFNYFGETLIHNLEQALSDSANSFMLLNSQGYWLRGKIPEDEWGFMYENRKDQTLAKRHPEVWKKISADNEGQITSDQGIYTFTTIWPLGSGMLSSTGSAVSNQASDSVLSGKNFFWKIVLQVPASKIAAVKTIILYKWLPYLSAIFISIVFLSLALSLAVSQRKKAIDAKLQKEKLQGVLEMAGAVCHELNQPMQVILGASQMMSFDVEKNDPIQDQIKLMDEHIVRMGVITQKLMNITKYKTKSYLKKNIIDIDEASDLIGT